MPASASRPTATCTAYGVPAKGSNMGVGDMVEIRIEAEFTGPPLKK